LKELGVEMLLVKNTLEAAQFAIEEGWVLEEDLVGIAQEKVKDEVENEQS
jgi:hypothetical protein